MQIKDPKPEIQRLEELALSVKSGEIKLPRFQRPFVWKKTDMLKLLDSIYKGYPIGSILIWNSSQKLISERSISGLEVDTEGNTLYPTNYLLDGQQRLTTLCGALFWNGKNETDEVSIWNICFDLENQEFVYPVHKDAITLFPLNKLINTSDFIRQCMKFESHNKRDEFYLVAERLLKSIKDYKIAVVKIGDMTIEEVAPIFERINSTGRKLTIVDLMMAATWSNSFDLAKEISKIKDQCVEYGFEDISDKIILRTISASADQGINKEDIQRLRGKSAEELSRATSVAGEALASALGFFKENLGIHDFSFIPYAFQLTYLTEIFRINPSLNRLDVKHITEWFWFTSATRYFGTSNTGQVSKDLQKIRDYASGKTRRLFETAEIDISQLLYDTFNLRNATSTTFALLLNNANPNQTIDGKPIDESHLRMKSKKFFETFAPNNAFYRQLNIAKIIYPYPMNISVSGHPFRYVEDVPERNLLNNNCLRFINESAEIEFLNERSNLIASKIQELTNCRAVTFKMPGNPVAEKDEEWISDDESNGNE